MQLPQNVIIDSTQLRGLVRERNAYAAALERIATFASDNEAVRIAKNALASSRKPSTTSYKE